jgi:hypothetical protein
VLCVWRPIEEVYDFVREAKHTRAVLQVAGRPRQGRPVDKDLWRVLGRSWPGDALAVQLAEVVSVLRTRLAVHGSLR